MREHVLKVAEHLQGPGPPGCEGKLLPIESENKGATRVTSSVIMVLAVMMMTLRATMIIIITALITDD